MGVVHVKRVYQGLGRIVGSFKLFGFPARLLANHAILDQFAEPDALLADVQFHFGCRGHAADRQRLGVAGDSQRVGRIVPGEDPPDCVGVRVVVEPAGKAVYAGDELPRGLVRR